MWDEHQTERIGLIDLGSNSARFVVMNVDANDSYHLFYQDKRAVRLSEGMQTDGYLTPTACQRTMDALQDFAHTASQLGVQQILAVATAAMRNAKNGMVFRDDVERHTGIPLTIISGREEARLGFLGVIHTLPYRDFILFDLGGASTEISLVQDGIQKEAISLPIGALSLTESFQTRDKITSAAKQALIKEVTLQFQKIPAIYQSGLPVIGIGGTVRNLAKIHQRQTGYPIPKLHHYQLPISEVNSLTDRLCSRNFNERCKISGLSPERADIICAGALLIDTLLQHVEAKELIISGCGLREGLFYHYYESHISPFDLNEDLLSRSIANFRDTLPLDNEEQMNYITRTALRIYDGLIPIHQKPARMRSLLESACRLHDTGMMINYYSHARHSAYIIANASLYGLTHREQAMCALIAGFQDGISNKLTRFSHYTRLLSETDIQDAKILSIFLAIAKAFDRTYDESITQIHISLQENRPTLHLVARDPESIPFIETAIRPHLERFRRYFTLPLHIEWEP